MKIYIASLLAIRDLQDDEDIQVENHLPFVALAESIEEAAEKAKKFAFEKWNPSDGWHTHRAEICPTDADFFKSAINVYKLGGFDLSEDEAPQTFHFIPDTFEAGTLM